MSIVEIVPGKSIGPFVLGMSRDQIDQAWEEWVSRSDAPIPDLAVDYRLNAEGRCHELWIRVINNENTLRLDGESVNDIDVDIVVERMRNRYPEHECVWSYACRSWPKLGLEVVKWESTDEWVDSIVISAPEPSPV